MASMQPMSGAKPSYTWERDGFEFPYEALSQTQAKALREELETAEARAAEDRELALFVKGFTNLLLPGFAKLVRNPRILDPVSRILGPDLLAWGCGLFIKEANTTNFVSWHQDLNYWGLDGAEEVTAWVALSPALVESGCMRFIPGSHQVPDLPHADTFDPKNLLSRGQEVQADVDDSNAADIELQPGQFSLHHGHLLHASNANSTADRRIGVAIRYIAPSMAQVTRDKTIVSLVRGEDRFGHFELAPVPDKPFPDEMIDLCREAVARKENILYRGASQSGRRVGT